jgi:hypothetical protein
MTTKLAPKREDRLKVCIAYGGTLCGIKEKAAAAALTTGRKPSFRETSAYCFPA